MLRDRVTRTVRVESVDDRWVYVAPADHQELREILGNLWLYVDWRYCTKQLTTEQKELWAVAVDEWRRDLNPGEDHPADRWWLCPTCGVDIRSSRDDGPHEGCMYAHDAKEETDRA
jgi:hypothetical protein